MNLTLKVWRQKNSSSEGKLVDYKIENISGDMSFLEMLDILNEKLLKKGEDPIAFDHDCREGICGMCSLFINGRPHGPGEGVTTCQLHMRSFKDGDKIFIEPFRAKGFPTIKDLVIDRGSFDRIIQAGGYISANTGSAPDANEIPISKEFSDKAMDSAACIGCGACVAACKNASAMLFVSAKVTQFAMLLRDRWKEKQGVENMVAQMDEEGFGSCTNTGACAAVCPKEIPLSNIAQLNRDFLAAKASSDKV